MNEKGNGLIPGIIIGLLVAAALFGAYYFGMFNSSNIQPNPQVVASPAPTAARMATVSGRLCYPSEGIPLGKIEAKSLSSDKIFSQEYAGSSTEGVNYTFELPADTYNLRYIPQIGTDPAPGYHTSVCPTGMKTSCGDKGKRVLVPVDLTSQDVTGYDICDFYYQPEDTPDF